MTETTPAPTSLRAPPALRILLLCEGDPETGDSWSGLTRSVLLHLRGQGHTVAVGDVELYGAQRLFTGARTFSPNRRRWAVRYHLGPAGFSLRSRNAQRHIASQSEDVDAILQIGATFRSHGDACAPVFIYCDSTITWAKLGQSTGQSDAAVLTHDEIAAVRAREEAIYRSARGIFTTSVALKHHFESEFQTAPEHVRAVFAGPNLDLNAIPARRTIRGVDAPPTVLFVGKRFERKGGPVLLRAFNRVRERIPDARLVIIGPPQLEVTQPGVECLGFVRKNRPGGWETIRAAYASADVFCLPTRFEPFGVAFVEAMHFGLPCVGTNAWALPEIIADGETGYLVPVDDENALTECVVHLLRNPELARSMGASGRARAQQWFTWDAVASRIAEAIALMTGAGAAHV